MRMYINEENEEIPSNIHEVKMKHVPLKMNQLFPNFRFWYSGDKDGSVRLVVYRKGIIFTVVLNNEDIRCLWGYDSVVHIEKMLDDTWEHSRTLLLKCMLNAGEPEDTVQLMACVMSDDGNIGYKVTGVKRAEDDDMEDDDMEEACDDAGSV